MFFRELANFLEIESWEDRDGTAVMSRNGVNIIAVPLIDNFDYSRLIPGPIYIYEDRWRTVRDSICERLMSHIGLGGRIFARNCIVREISANEASMFLGKNHSYGDAKSKYRYGLFVKGSGDPKLWRGGHREEYGEGVLVAVATFSSPRPMDRGGEIVSSYEWTRYASLPSVRVAGGMGKLLNQFVKEVAPQEIMSYADVEWSEGGVYTQLGFERVSVRPPIDFVVDRDNFHRISIDKIMKDRKFLYMQKLLQEEPSRFVKISNLGSIKYLKRYY
jgi:hypothetical protein